MVFTFSMQLQSSMKYLKKTSFSEKLLVNLGLPFLDEKGSLEFTSAQEMSEDSTTTRTRTTSVTYQLTQQVCSM